MTSWWPGFFGSPATVACGVGCDGAISGQMVTNEEQVYCAAAGALTQGNIASGRLFSPLVFRQNGTGIAPSGPGAAVPASRDHNCR